MAQRPNNQEDEKKVPSVPKNDEQPSKGDEQKQPSQSMPSYLEAALRIPTSYPLGAPIQKALLPHANDWAGFSVRNCAAGILAYDYIPTLGVSNDATSALNRAAYQDFNKIRSQISGNRPYEPADAMIYRVAVTAMHELFAYATRIYKVINTYRATNLYKPRAVLAAMGLDAEDWIRNAADLFQWLQVHAGSMEPFPGVKIGNIDDRHMVFDSYLFKDGEAESSQTYIINHRWYWSYETVDEVKGLSLREFPRTYSAFTTMWDEMYVALQGSSDVYVIAADIRRAFGDNVYTSLTPPAAGDTVEYVKLDPVLTSIMNANVLSSDVDSEQLNHVRSFRIYDDPSTSVLKCTPSYIPNFSGEYFDASTKPWIAQREYLNMVQDEPTPTDILHAVRLMPTCVFESADAGTVRVTVTACGTEVVMGARMVVDTLEDPTVIPLCGALVVLPDAADTEGFIQVVSSLSQFDWHHPLVLAKAMGVQEDAIPINAFTACGMLEDLQNYVPFSARNSETIFDAVLLAEFGF